VSEQRNVKVFISWSQDLARDVAVALREWLPLLFDRVEPWASDTDIAAGQRGLAQIEAELGNTKFGIVVVTAANQHAPWLNFEAGALSKTIPGDIEQRVVPLMVDLRGPTQLTGPLSQFQAKAADREGVKSLLQSLAAVAGIEQRVVDQRFEAYWPQLEQRIAAAKQRAAEGQPVKPRRNQADVLDEILLHVRQLRSEIEAAPAASAGDLDLSVGSSRRQMEGEDDLVSGLVRLAASHGLRVFQVERSFDSTAVTVSPRGKYSQEDVDTFTRLVRDRLGSKVKVTAVPF
jgi:hypothetical protein